MQSSSCKNFEEMLFAFIPNSKANNLQFPMSTHRPGRTIRAITMKTNQKGQPCMKSTDEDKAQYRKKVQAAGRNVAKEFDMIISIGTSHCTLLLKEVPVRCDSERDRTTTFQKVATCDELSLEIISYIGWVINSSLFPDIVAVRHYYVFIQYNFFFSLPNFADCPVKGPEMMTACAVLIIMST